MTLTKNPTLLEMAAQTTTRYLVCLIFGRPALPDENYYLGALQQKSPAAVLRFGREQNMYEAASRPNLFQLLSQPWDTLTIRESYQQGVPGIQRWILGSGPRLDLCCCLAAAAPCSEEEAASVVGAVGCSFSAGCVSHESWLDSFCHHPDVHPEEAYPAPCPCLAFFSPFVLRLVPSAL